MTLDTVLRVHVAPRSARDEILGWRDGVLHVRLRAPPVQGRANEALGRLMAAGLGVSPGAVRIVAGAGARTKTVRIEGLDQETVLERLA